MPFDLDAVADALGKLGQYASKRSIYFGDYTSLMASLPAHSIPADQIRADLQALKSPDRAEARAHFLGNATRMAERSHLASVLRIIEQAQASAKGPVEPPVILSTRPTELSIVFVAAQPHGAANINMGKELRQIRAELRSSIGRDRLKLADIQTSAHTDVIQRILLEGAGNVLHFSGHGIEGALVLEQPDGSIFKLPNALFVNMIRLVNQQRGRGEGHPPYRFAVLNACFSSTLARELVDAGVLEAAVGTTIAVPDSAAMAFAKRFYGALADGSPMNEAHQWAQMQVQLAGKGPEVGAAFELHVAEGVDAAELRV